MGAHVSTAKRGFFCSLPCPPYILIASRCAPRPVYSHEIMVCASGNSSLLRSHKDSPSCAPVPSAAVSAVALVEAEASANSALPLCLTLTYSFRPRLLSPKDSTPLLTSICTLFRTMSKTRSSIFTHLQTLRARRQTSTPATSISSELLGENTRVGGTIRTTSFFVSPTSCRLQAAVRGALADRNLIPSHHSSTRSGRQGGLRA